MSRSILGFMGKGQRRLFTVPLELEDIIGIHVASQLLEDRKATQYVYLFIKKQIQAAKEKYPREYHAKYKEEEKRVTERSKSGAKARKRGLRKTQPAKPQVDRKEKGGTP